MKERKFSDKTFQTIIGNLLRYGVWLALSVGAVGGILYLIYHGNEPVDFSIFSEDDKSIGQLLREIFTGLTEGGGPYIIFLGVIILFLTPALRLILSLFAFLREKDYLYVIITLIVITIIAVSASLGSGH